MRSPAAAAGTWLLPALQAMGTRIMHGLPAAFGGQDQQCGSRAKVSIYLARASRGVRMWLPKRGFAPLEPAARLQPSDEACACCACCTCCAACAQRRMMLGPAAVVGLPLLPGAPAMACKQTTWEHVVQVRAAAQEAGASNTSRHMHSSSVPPRWMTSNTAANFCCPPTKPISPHLHEAGADLVADVAQRAGAVRHEHCGQQRGGKGRGGLRGIVRHRQVICHQPQGLALATWQLLLCTCLAPCLVFQVWMWLLCSPVLDLPLSPMSFSVSKYCVMSRSSMTSRLFTSDTSDCGSGGGRVIGGESGQQSRHVWRGSQLL